MLRKILIIIFFVLTPTLTFAAPPFNNIVIFGDSLSDNGNMYTLSMKLLPKSPPYFQGDFSDGDVWSQIVLKKFKTLNISFENYALGGETAVLHSLFDGFLPISIGESISNYYLQNFLKDKTKTLFIIWIGGNDYLNGSKDVAGDTDKVVTEIHNQIVGLMLNGGKNFLIMGLPDLAATPRAVADGTTEVLHELAVQHNDKLFKNISDLQKQYPEININYFDVYSLFNDIIHNLDKYNKQYHTHLSNVKDACWGGGYSMQNSLQEKNMLLRELEVKLKNNSSISPKVLANYIFHSPDLMESYRVSKLAEAGILPCADQDDYIFWDHVHPTSVVHAIFANIIYEYIQQHYVM